ncbi:hypothetical protein [Clostridium sp. 'White wine YQ']|uniref:hypothetical protein n=1 Tax=Clostridium sp. 'White wine YQ' TaxID=3027474 RepID=UPI002366162C|nr:hypothetical protein [Clostridium sp. 'White wine YQ']MDD7793081.1 hypothetical protein [Clostridium sp. 'White wine YQ']
MNIYINKNNLSGDYKTAYFDILNYLQSSDISVNSKLYNEVSEDMMDMLLSAQNNSLPVDNIIGTDIKIFCKDIINSYNSKSTIIVSILKKVTFSLVFLTFVSFLFQLFYGKIALSLVVVILLTWSFSSTLINFFYRKFFLRFRGLKNRILCILVTFVLCMVLLFPIIMLLASYLTIGLNGYLVSAISLLLIFIFHYICKKLDKNIKWYSYLR